ncbi:FkbM family methyltransferase [Cellulomonas sp. KRMCY2]|uniref:FkbM family methyltransferase n=1 Tax=Cellulomonas sp. KRMCY2 TaxID=1304865 RepID=UPI00045E89F7|nr:FkbM family methyltransferase [Cellulomonas sp. KRMCY2]
MPTASPFHSYAQNNEDVVLWRALRDVSVGRYVEVGANHPLIDSVSRAFYDRGWSGITVEPVPYFAELQRAERPRDLLVEAAIGTTDGEITLHLVPGTGLSTVVDAVSVMHASEGIDHVDVTVPSKRLDDVLSESGWSPDDDLHFMLVDVEGAEQDVLASVDLTRWRPRVLVVEATAPNAPISTHEAWEPAVLSAGYQLCLFDGVSRFYVADERADELRPALSYPACAHDNFISRPLLTAQQEREELRGQAAHWRTVALTAWADAVQEASTHASGVSNGAEFDALHAQVAAMEATLSWRVTAPLRAVRRAIDGVRGR